MLSRKIMEKKTGVGAEVREWMLAKLSLPGHKKRIRRAMQAIDEAMEAERSFMGLEEVVTVPDHRIRLTAVSLVVSIYGLEAEKQSKFVVVGDPDSPLQLSTVDRRYVESLIAPSSP